MVDYGEDAPKICRCCNCTLCPKEERDKLKHTDEEFARPDGVSPYDMCEGFDGHG